MPVTETSLIRFGQSSCNSRRMGLPSNSIKIGHVEIRITNFIRNASSPHSVFPCKACLRNSRPPTFSINFAA